MKRLFATSIDQQPFGPASEGMIGSHQLPVTTFGKRFDFEGLQIAVDHF